MVDVVATVYALGFHQEFKGTPSLPFFLAESRRKVFWFAYMSDKNFATFFGRPPMVTGKFCSANCKAQANFWPHTIVLTPTNLSTFRSRRRPTMVRRRFSQIGSGALRRPRMEPKWTRSQDVVASRLDYCGMDLFAPCFLIFSMHEVNYCTLTISPLILAFFLMILLTQES